VCVLLCEAEEGGLRLPRTDLGLRRDGQRSQHGQAHIVMSGVDEEIRALQVRVSGQGRVGQGEEVDDDDDGGVWLVTALHAGTRAIPHVITTTREPHAM